MATIIDALYEQNREAVGIISGANEISVASDIDNKLKKHLIMAAASYFETEVRSAIEQLASDASANNPAVIALIKQKALERQYHTYFDWKSRNANTFFAHFGEEFSKKCRNQVKEQEGLNDSVSAFLELGEMRNKLAHLNFALFPIDKTSEEIYHLYQRALAFLEYVKKSLKEASAIRGEIHKI
jgi:RiboL-PSP-HEPN